MSQDPWSQFNPSQPGAPSPQPQPRGAPQAHQPSQPYPPQQQGYPQQSQNYGQPAAAICTKSPIAAGILALLLGNLGVHKFYLGYTNEGLIFLMVYLINLPLLIFLWWLVFPLLIALALSTIALVEGIIYLTKPEAEFCQTYVYSRKPWF